MFPRALLCAVWFFQAGYSQPRDSPADESYLNPAPPALPGTGYFKRGHAHHHKYGKWDGWKVLLEDFDDCGPQGCFTPEQREAMALEEERIAKEGAKPDWDNFVGPWIEKDITFRGKEDSQYKIAHFENACRACCACMWQSDDKNKTETSDMCHWGLCPDPYPFEIEPKDYNASEENGTKADLSEVPISPLLKPTTDYWAPKTQSQPTFCYSHRRTVGYYSCMSNLGGCFWEDDPTGKTSGEEKCMNCLPGESTRGDKCKRDKTFHGAYPSQCTAPTNARCRYPKSWNYPPIPRKPRPEKAGIPENDEEEDEGDEIEEEIPKTDGTPAPSPIQTEPVGGLTYN